MRDSRNEPSPGEGESRPERRPHHELVTAEGEGLDALRAPPAAIDLLEEMLSDPSKFGSPKIRAAIAYYLADFHFAPGRRVVSEVSFEEPSGHAGLRQIYRLFVSRSAETRG